MFSRYASLVKNLRGVLFPGKEEGIEKCVEWLVRRFKYRNVGIPPSVLERKRGLFEPYLGGKPFVELAYPVGSLEKLVELFSSLGTERTASESVALASAYVSPMLVFGKIGLERLKPLCAGYIKSRIKLTDRDWKLHLRIADYTVLDLYRWSVENAEKLWVEKNSTGIIEARAERIARDKKRYWRLQGEETPRPFLLYLDPVRFLAKNAAALKKLIKLPREEVSAGLAILAAVCLPD